MSHDDFMRRAIEVAKGDPEAPFGTLIADRANGRAGAEGVNQGQENPIRHRELVALRGLDASVEWSRLALYTTAEPCPMCVAAILWSGGTGELRRQEPRRGLESRSTIEPARCNNHPSRGSYGEYALHVACTSSSGRA